MKKGKKRMLVLGGVRKSCLVVIRELHEEGFHVTIGNQERVCLGFLTRYADRRIITPPVNDTEKYVEFILNEVKKNKYEMLYGTGGDISNLISLHREELSKYTKVLVPDYETIKIANNKVDTIKAAMEAGIPVPKTYFPDRSNIDAQAVEMEYPVLIKPAVGTGARGITKAESPEEMRRKFHIIESEYGQSFVQELVPQPHDQYKVDMLFDTQGNVVAEIVYKKHRFYPADGGSSVLCSSVEFPEILDHARTILKHMKWIGFADFDFIYDPVRKLPLLIEINPRFPESYGIGNVSGINFSLQMYRIASGEKVSPLRSYALNQYFRFLPGDMLWFLTSPNRFKAKPGFFNFFNRDLHYQILSLRDPGPFLAYVIENLRMMLNGKKRRERFKLTRV